MLISFTRDPKSGAQPFVYDLHPCSVIHWQPDPDAMMNRPLRQITVTAARAAGVPLDMELCVLGEEEVEQLRETTRELPPVSTRPMREAVTE